VSGEFEVKFMFGVSCQQILGW